MIDYYYLDRNRSERFINTKLTKDIARTLLANKSFCGGGCLMVKANTMTEQELLELSKDYALNSNKYDEDENNNTNPNFRIRKLTPRECWRLMGVKDEDYEKVAKNQSNSSLYHLAGDSIVTNVLMAIFSQMKG